jgi:hypothetical protein
MDFADERDVHVTVVVLVHRVIGEVMRNGKTGKYIARIPRNVITVVNPACFTGTST